jgi:hypothetical protein
MTRLSFVFLIHFRRTRRSRHCGWWYLQMLEPSVGLRQWVVDVTAEGERRDTWTESSIVVSTGLFRRIEFTVCEREFGKRWRLVYGGNSVQTNWVVSIGTSNYAQFGRAYEFSVINSILLVAELVSLIYSHVLGSSNVAHLVSKIRCVRESAVLLLKDDAWNLGWIV